MENSESVGDARGWLLSVNWYFSNDFARSSLELEIAFSSE
jgi:hypothetical protein